jgi:photosystem II stability/assembly factor-like uncharacterized protein
MRLLCGLITILCLPLSITLPALAQDARAEADKKQAEQKPADPMSPPTFAGLKLRNIGPALMSGRVIAFAVDPHDRAKYYVAVASGGVWKTVNSGTTWTPVFDNEGSYSIGAIALDPKNPATVWVGTGELNSQRSVGYGDGVYRSDDGGRTWRNIGLKKSEHIARIVIDPRDSNTVYVASQGPLWGPGGDRGLFKTTDGGKTWKNVLNISEHTGVTDVVMDPREPDVLYAAAYQRRRHVFTLINGGPESAMYKSTDAGATWTKLRTGLPTVEMGRIGLAVSPANPDVLYATIEAANKQGGIFRSQDRGATWEKRNDFDSTAMYYGQIICDPKNVDRVYVPNVFMMVSDDGGRTLRRLGEKSKHVDNHAIWVDPNNTNYYLVGSDGGVYESFDRGQNWHYKANLPVTQFYDVAVDNAAPFYNICGGTQDNATLCGPSRTRSLNGITNGDWFVTVFGDGFRVAIDPTDPNIIYSEYQYGGLVRFDKKSGERMGIQPQPGKGEPPLRWNWDSPLIISPHSHTRLYFAANILFRSDDRGDTWKAVSGDLTRQVDRDKLPVMGKVWGPDAVAKHASTSFFGNIVALSESPKKEGLIYVGTDDGLIQVTEDGGARWRKVERFPGVPEMTYVSRLVASQHDARTVYATFNNHKNADFKPYILKSADAGATWTAMASNLPENAPVWAIAEDHVNPNLLFIGTEFGLYFTADGGKKWVQLKGNMPTIAVRDLAIQRRENDLVVGTFGRGFYVLDDYTPLRAVKPETLVKEAELFPTKDALMYIRSVPLGLPGKSMQGESFYTADNPPFGATFTYFLKDALKTRRQLRQDAEKEAEKKKLALTYPSKDDLRAEEEEEAPAIILTVADAGGRVVRRLAGPAAAGMNRVTWDLRDPSVVLPPPRPPSAEEENPFADPPGGPLVMPGKYTVSLSKRVGGVTTQLAGPQSFEVVVDGAATVAAADRASLVEFQQKVARLQRAVSGTLQTANELKSRLALIKRALQETPSAEARLFDQAAEYEQRLNRILVALRGDTVLAARNENVPPSINDRVSAIVSQQRMSTSRPTATHAEQYRIASEELQQELTRLRTLVETDVARLENAMEAAGAPWTPGRIPVWNGNDR